MKLKKFFINALMCLTLLSSISFSSCSTKNNVPSVPPQIPDNQIKYELWNNSELKNNLFSTVQDNKKLKIVPERGANDITNSEFGNNRVNANPLYKKIINEKYKKLAQISYSVNFKEGGANFLGTTWILDYQIPNNISQKVEGNSYNDENYPQKWFFATNSHVMDDLKTPFTDIYELNTGTKNAKATSSVVFRRIKNININSTYGPSSASDAINYWETFTINLKNQNDELYQDPAIKPIFIGFDYLNSSPYDFIENVPEISSDNEQRLEPDILNYYRRTQEMADFAIFELDFSKINPNDIPSEFNGNTRLFAKHFTNNYANWSEKDQFKIAQKSLLNEENLEEKRFYSLGFPQEYAVGGNRYSNHVSVAINQPETLNHNNYSRASSKLVLDRYYNTFKNVSGIFDSIIGSADFGYKLNPPNSSNVSSSGIVPYIYQGLLYVEENGDMQVGSSGSIFVDENNYIYGIHFASDFTAHVGINFALRSEGYNYEGKYGIYNLEPYDLINGGFENQKNSYKDRLKKIYGNTNMKTNIFKNGIK